MESNSDLQAENKSDLQATSKSDLQVTSKSDLRDVRLATGVKPLTVAGLNNVFRHVIRTRGRGIKYRRTRYGYTASDWMENIYDLSEISRAADVEGHLATSFRKHREMCLKEGWTLSSKDDATLKRIRQRIREIELMSDTPFSFIIREITTNLIKFSTAFLYTRRDKDRSTGRIVRLHGKRLEPIAAVEVIDPTTMRAKQNKSGRVIKWLQSVPEQGDEVEFEPEDIITFTIDKKSGFIFGTPYCLPVLDDIRALRRLEELVEVISSKHAFPLFHYQVGTEKKPATDYVDANTGSRTSEVDIVQMAIADMPLEGGYVTSERHKITVIGAEGQALDLKPYLEYFEKRVLGGLRLSDQDLGRGGSPKGTATTISKNIADAAKDFQQVIAETFNFYLFRRMLWEEDIEDSEDNDVMLVFPAVDQEQERAHQNHALGLFQGGILTEDEARLAIGREPISDEERNNLQIETQQMPLLKMESELQAKVAAAKSTASSNSTKSKTQPQNQHGKKATKTAVKANDISSIILSTWDSMRYTAIYREIDPADGGLVSFIKNTLFDAIKTPLTILIDDTALLVGDTIPTSDVKEVFFNRYIKEDLKKIATRTNMLAVARSDQVSPTIGVVGAFDALEPHIGIVGNRIKMLAAAFSMLQVAQAQDDDVTINGMLINKTDHVRGLARTLIHNEIVIGK